VPFEGPSGVARWAAQRGHALDAHAVYSGAPLPSPEATEALLVLGGPMGVHDERQLPWLTAEKRYIEAALKRTIPVLGICLGAQLLADVMGASVRRAARAEIGWFPVTFTAEALAHPLFEGFPPELNVMHWHGDTFEQPAGMRPVGHSEACANQGFFDAHGRLMGLQFHMEWDADTAARLIEACPEDLHQGGPFVQTPQDILDRPACYAAAQDYMHCLLDRLYGPVPGALA